MDVQLTGLQARNISKRYGHTQALMSVDLSVVPGQVHGLVGHNGAGKSTLLRVLSGAESADSGDLLLDGSRVHLGSPREAIEVGVSCVYQELSLVDDLTVAQNLFLGHEVRHGMRLRLAEMERLTASFLAEFGLFISPSTKVRQLPVAQRQLIEIVTALHRNARYVLLDEPTTSLEASQVELLLATIRRIARDRRVAVLLVDHRLDEIYAVADHITALRNGRVVISGPASATKQEDVIRVIVGEERPASPASEVTPGPQVPGVIGRFAPESEQGPDELALVARDLRSDRLSNVTLTARAGRVLGIYGLVGSGRTEFLRAVYGSERLHGGDLTLFGKPYSPRDPEAAIKAGIAYLSEERKADGFVPALTPIVNTTLPVLQRFERWKMLRLGRAGSAAEAALDRVEVRGDIRAPMDGLSGGNQQRVLFARVVLQEPRLLLLDEPTKGVDIGAKKAIHDIIRSIVSGPHICAIVVCSEEDEILSLADDIIVFRGGRCDGEVYSPAALKPGDLPRIAWASADQAVSEAS
jgi:ribose transport system ATP-binding protein